MSGHLGKVTADEVDTQRGRELLDETAQRLLGMSGEEFLARWERGDIADVDHVAAMKVAALIPLAR